eukprot:scaffold2671_cov167-Amphora_coffeaeformis.AAC.17
MPEASERAIRVLVISMGGPRQEAIQLMLQDIGGFAPPVFSPGVPSRELRNRSNFFKICHRAGILPEEEWEQLQHNCENPPPDSHTFFQCLKGVPISPDRRGSQSDVKLHYCDELWRKAKTINRGRSVLGCILAHLIALRTFVDGDFDVLLEDNVRAPLDGEAARRIRETIESIKQHESVPGTAIHLRYFGWLGSMLNLQWNFQSHLPSRRVTRDESSCSVAPFPTQQHIEEDLESGRYVVDTAESFTETTTKTPGKVHTTPGGTPCWGAYAYWMSKEAYEELIGVLQKDVGALMWKTNHARYYTVKPIDKILPRTTGTIFGSTSVMISTRPAFFRAPMLTSKIHAKWDPDFCKSTEYQLTQTNLTWSSLWLTDAERLVVQHRQRTGEWLSPANLEQNADSLETINTD